MKDVLLPIPPSSNHLFANIPKKGRVRTATYNAWRTDAGYMLNAARVAPVASPVAVLIRCGPMRSNRDLASVEKAITDLLVTHGIIIDDSSRHVVDMHLVLTNEVPAGMVSVSVTHLDV